MQVVSLTEARNNILYDEFTDTLYISNDNLKNKDSNANKDFG